jgi:hypothetical protein
MALSLATPLPKGCEYLADICEKVAPQYGISPYTLLGVLYAESNFGQALKPVGPKGTGDFIARLADKDTNERMAKAPLPGVERKVLADGIKARKIAGPCEAWVPTNHGWGMGLFQIDYEMHFDFCKTGGWSDPEKACHYACKLLKSGRDFIAKKHPSLSEVELTRAMIAAYNAGPGRVSKFLSEGKDIDGCTFHTGYIDKIAKKADLIAGASGAFMHKNSALV